MVESEPENGWIQISSGYISTDYAEIKYALNEARKLDMRAMVLNLYKNLGISSVDNYLNVRDQPSEDGNIIGKMTSKSAGEILETSEDGGWYKIQSGPVTGYVKAEYILTGDAAKQEAMEVAELMAIVSTDRLNARTEPSTDAPIWTQISNNERYDVISQQDGWVEIALDTTSAYVATDFVDVRYALPEARRGRSGFSCRTFSGFRLTYRKVPGHPPGSSRPPHPTAPDTISGASRSPD